MARTANSMVTFQDLDDMVSFEGFSYVTNPITPPSNLNTCATKLDVLGYLDANLSRNTADNQLVSYSIIVPPAITDELIVIPDLFNTSNSSKILQVSVECSSDWTVSVSDNWIICLNNGSGDETFDIFVDENNDTDPRSATVTFTVTSSGSTANVVINQAGFDV